MDNEVPGRDGFVFGLSFEEAREEVARIGRGSRVGKGVRRDLPFRNAREPEADDGVHADGL